MMESLATVKAYLAATKDAAEIENCRVEMDSLEVHVGKVEIITVPGRKGLVTAYNTLLKIDGKYVDYCEFTLRSKVGELVTLEVKMPV